jgi:hypothetical protein
MVYVFTGAALAANSGVATSLRKCAPKGITEAFYACAEKAGGDMLALRWLDFNAESVDAELDLRAADTSANIEASLTEVFRHCDRANVLESFVFLESDL